MLLLRETLFRLYTYQDFLHAHTAHSACGSLHMTGSVQ